MGRIKSAIIGGLTGGLPGAIAGAIMGGTQQSLPSGVKKGAKSVGGVTSHTRKADKILGKFGKRT